MYIAMKKIYSTPSTELLHLNIRPVMQVASLDKENMKQDLTNPVDLKSDDTGVGSDYGGNLGKGNDIWDAWGE